MLVDREAPLVEVLVHGHERAAHEKRVGGVRLPAAPHEDLPELLELARLHGRSRQLLAREWLHRLVLPEEERVRGEPRPAAPRAADCAVRAHLRKRRREARRVGIVLLEEVDVLEQVLVHAADGKAVVRVERVAVAVEKRRVGLCGVRDPHPPHPVGVERHRTVAPGEVLARRGEPRVEDIEVPHGVDAHRVAGRARAERAVVARAVAAELQHLPVEGVPLDDEAFRQLVAVAVAERGESRVPHQVLHAVAAGVHAARVAAADRGTPLARLDVLAVPHERHDDRAPFVVGQRLVDPVVCAERVDARRGVPVHRTPVRVRLVVALHVREQHGLRLREVLWIAREPPRERAFGALDAPLVDVRDAGVDGIHGEAGAVLRLARACAHRVVRIAVAPLQERVARRPRRTLRPRLHGRPRLLVEEHARMVAAYPPQPLRLLPRRNGRQQARRRNTHYFYHIRGDSSIPPTFW